MTAEGDSLFLKRTVPFSLCAIYGRLNRHANGASMRIIVDC